MIVLMCGKKIKESSSEQNQLVYETRSRTTMRTMIMRPVNYELWSVALLINDLLQSKLKNNSQRSRVLAIAHVPVYCGVFEPGGGAF